MGLDFTSSAYSGVITFFISYCKRNSWDRRRPACEARTINVSSGLENKVDRRRSYHVVVNGLHPATSQLFHVTPVSNQESFEGEIFLTTTECE